MERYAKRYMSLAVTVNHLSQLLIVSSFLHGVSRDLIPSPPITRTPHRAHPMPLLIARRIPCAGLPVRISPP
jgi:hypothetical protein